MASCKDCVHFEACKNIYEIHGDGLSEESHGCDHFKDRARFVELHHAEWVEDEDVCGVPIFRCSNCDERFVLEEGTPFDNCYFYCPYCGAKMDEKALKKERETDE